MSSRCERLMVHLHGRHVADLLRSGDGRVELAYTDRYLDEHPRVPLSLSLPPSKPDDAQAARWIDGLLPGNPRVRDKWADRYGAPTPAPFPGRWSQTWSSRPDSIQPGSSSCLPSRRLRPCLARPSHSSRPGPAAPTCSPTIRRPEPRTAPRPAEATGRLAGCAPPSSGAFWAVIVTATGGGSRSLTCTGGCRSPLSPARAGVGDHRRRALRGEGPALLGRPDERSPGRRHRCRPVTAAGFVDPRSF